MATALLAVVAAAAVAFLPAGEAGWQQKAALAEAQQHGRIALEELVNELYYASSVSVDADGPYITYFKLKDGVQKRYRFYVAGRQLFLHLPEGTAVPLAGCIDGLFVQPPGTVGPGQPLQLTVTVSFAGRRVTLRTAILPKNLNEAGY